MAWAWAWVWVWVWIWVWEHCSGHCAQQHPTVTEYPTTAAEIVQQFQHGHWKSVLTFDWSEQLRLLLGLLILSVGVRFAIELVVQPADLFTIRELGASG